MLATAPFPPPLGLAIPHSPAPELVVNQLTVHPGNFRNVAIVALQNVLFLLRIAKWKVAYADGKSFCRSEQLPYFARVSEDDLVGSFDAVIEETFSTSEDAGLALLAKSISRRLVAATTITSLVSALDEVDRLNTAGLESLGGAEYSTFTPSPGSSLIGSPMNTPPTYDPDTASQLAKALGELQVGGEDNYFGYKREAPAASLITFAVVHHPERLVISWPAEHGKDFLHAVSRIAQVVRDEKRDPTFVEFVAFHLGYQLLNQGHNPFDPIEARFLGTVGFRQDAQTYVSLTDPGDGHVFGTTRKSRWMKGAIVHVEHLERPQNLPREAIESYRIPSILDFARVRMHTGAEAPNTYFVGRALKDSRGGEFGHDFIKVVNTISSAATAAFQLGSAECKVAMDGLKASQMVAYMRALAAHTLRNHRQYFSAAFNLNNPLVDDLQPNPDGTPRIIADQLAIGHRGIDLALLGGFDKCTWDGAADSYPSHCVVLQLGFQNSLELVHRAHSLGLTTYMSAGFKLHNIRDAVLSGVDGIGIGGAQILRYMDSVSGMHGPYTEEYIDRIIIARDNAGNSVRGRGARLLARLDQMHFEGSLSSAEEALRGPLYDALYDADEEEIQQILEDDDAALDVLALPIDGEQPWLGRAKRILCAGDPLLRQGAMALPNGEELWEDFVESLRNLVDDRDEMGLYSYSLCEPWKNFGRAYRAAFGQGGLVQGETRVSLKIAPYCS